MNIFHWFIRLIINAILGAPEPFDYVSTTCPYDQRKTLEDE